MAEAIIAESPPDVCPCGSAECAGNARRAHESRVAQGLGPFVTDAAVLARLDRISAASCARASAA